MREEIESNREVSKKQRMKVVEVVEHHIEVVEVIGKVIEVMVEDGEMVIIIKKHLICMMTI